MPPTQRSFTYYTKKLKCSSGLPIGLVPMAGCIDQTPPLIKYNRIHREFKKFTTGNAYKAEKIYLCSLNVRTLKSEEKLLELENALNNIKWHVIGLAEIRRSIHKILVFLSLI